MPVLVPVPVDGLVVLVPEPLISKKGTNC